MKQKRYWVGDVSDVDDFGRQITDEFVDGRTVHRGMWATMSPLSWRENGCGQLGTGSGQRYRRQRDGQWMKVEG